VLRFTAGREEVCAAWQVVVALRCSWGRDEGPRDARRPPDPGGMRGAARHVSGFVDANSVSACIGGSVLTERGFRGAVRDSGRGATQAGQSAGRSAGQFVPEPPGLLDDERGRPQGDDDRQSLEGCLTVHRVHDLSVVQASWCAQRPPGCCLIAEGRGGRYTTSIGAIGWRVEPIDSAMSLLAVPQHAEGELQRRDEE